MSQFSVFLEKEKKTTDLSIQNGFILLDTLGENITDNEKKQQTQYGIGRGA